MQRPISGVRSRNSARGKLLLAAAPASALGGRAVWASTDTWVGDTSADMAEANWTGAANNPPISGDSWVFGAAGSAGLNLNNNLTTGASWNVAGITFNSGAGAFVIGNGTTVQNTGGNFILTGTVTNNSTATETINSPFSLGGNETFNMAAGNISLGGLISGTGYGIATAGPNRLTFNSTSASTFTGGLAVNGDTVVVDFANAASLSNLLSSSNTLTLSGGMLRVIASPSGNSTQSFTGTQILSGLSVVDTASGVTGNKTAMVNVGNMTEVTGGLLEFAHGGVDKASGVASTGVASWAIRWPRGMGPPRTMSRRDGMSWTPASTTADIGNLSQVIRRGSAMKNHSIRISLLTLVLLVLGAARHEDSASPGAILPQVTDQSMAGYKLVWHDEFDGDKLNAAEWNYRTDARHWSVQKPENVSLGGGMLHLACRKEEAGKLHYTGGGIISKKAFKYGYYESRFKVPPGGGWHTSFWMMHYEEHGAKSEPVDAVQELDVCENDSLRLTDYGVNVHQWIPKPHQVMGHKTVKTPDLSENFHVFGCEFTAKTVKYFFDGKLVQTVDATKFPHGDQNIWLTTIASGLGGAKKVDDDKLPAECNTTTSDFSPKNK